MVSWILIPKPHAAIANKDKLNFVQILKFLCFKNTIRVEKATHRIEENIASCMSNKGLIPE